MAESAVLAHPAAVTPSVPGERHLVAGDEMTFSGHGWGHGRGMGQYGALGHSRDQRPLRRQMPGTQPRGWPAWPTAAPNGGSGRASSYPLFDATVPDHCTTVGCHRISGMPACWRHSPVPMTVANLPAGLGFLLLEGIVWAGPRPGSTPRAANREQMTNESQVRAARLATEPLRAAGPRQGFVRGTVQSLRDIVGQGELLGLLVRRELKARYKDSMFGFFWSLAKPLAMLLVYYIAIGKFLGAESSPRNPGGIPSFAVFIFTGLTAWQLFSDIIVSGTGSIVANGGLIKKVY